MWRKLGIGPGEGRVFAWGAGALFLLGWTDVSLKNVSETLFLKRVGVEYLPLVFLANSVLLVVTTGAMGRLAARSDRLKLLPRALGGLAFLLLPLWWLVLGGVESVFGVLVLASKQLTSIALLVFWIAMGDLLHGRQAKRLFAPMMAGVTLGTILGSFASGPLGRWLGIESLLPVSGIALALAAAATIPLRGLRPHFDRATRWRLADAQRDARDERGSLRSLFEQSPLFRLLFAVAVCSGLLGPMLYFQFSYVADLATQGAGGEQRLLTFYSQFRGWISVGTLVVQLLVSGSLYRRLGVPLSAALSPLVYLAGFLGLSLRMSLPVGVGAMAGTKLQDDAVADPALRVLYNLFSEEVRPRATALLEGPLKRGGGALGNLAILGALRVGSAPWVGYIALPVAVAWLLAALVLWRRYPRLLLEASASRTRVRDVLEGGEMLDRATLRALVPEMCSADADRARVAIDLVSEARPEHAVRALAEAAGAAPEPTRPLIVAALDRLLERAVTEPIQSPRAARLLEALLAEPGRLVDRDRADLVQAYGRLLAPGEGGEVIQRALADPSPAVRLAALAALDRRGARPAGEETLDAALARAAAGADAAARRTAREEYRALLLGGEPGALFEERLRSLTHGLAREADRVETAEALAEVAAVHGAAAAAARDAMLALREDANPRVRAALLRYCGHARLLDQTSWLVDHVASEQPEWAVAARDGLRALGPLGSDALLRELAYGRRSKHLGILEVIREIEVQPETLRALYDAELDAVERDLGCLLALGERPAFALLRQRLDERVREELHAALLLLASIRREERIAELGNRLRRTRAGARQQAILVEALESLLPAEERDRLLPLLEETDLAAAARRTASVKPLASVDEALRILRSDAEELTREIASGLALAVSPELDDHRDVNTVEKALHLKKLPIFAELTARQLMDLAVHVRERVLPEGEVVVRQGEYDDCLYLVVEGVVHIVRGDALLAEVAAGGFFGEIALFEGIARTATAVTRTRTRLLGLERGDMIHLIEEMPGIAISLLETMSRRVRELTDRLLV